MVGSRPRANPEHDAATPAPQLVDPRRGDAEDDASSTKQRSLFAIAGGLVAEISLPKLLFAWITLILLPGIVLGLAPLVATAWLETVSNKIAALAGTWTLVVLLAVALVGWVGARSLFRVAETNFWSLNAIAVQPSYALCREALRHLAERLLRRDANPCARARLRAASAVGAGFLVCAGALCIVAVAWPFTRWVGQMWDIASPQLLIRPAVANAVVLVAGYLAAASLVWGTADGTMDQPADLDAFDTAPGAGSHRWRIAHLSDVHVVGQRYGFRIESGRSGPRGNERLANVLARIAALHEQQPIDLIMVTGDMTDAGLSTEWAEFLDAMARYPELSSRTIILPGNHDLNIVDRANPARLDLPFSPGKRLRQIRTLSAMAALEGERVHVFDRTSGELTYTLNDALAPYRDLTAAFADAGSLRLSIRLRHLWSDLFPMVLLPDREDGLGAVILNSNAEAHFSFTNALGMISVEQAHALGAIAKKFPRARWIVGLHHHIMEYPMPVDAFSERIGTALINGSWFFRQLRPLAERVVVMHGHRHIDWIGRCGRLKILSAPSPVMGAKDNEPSYFHIHTLAAGSNGALCLLPPERVNIPGGNVDEES